VSWPLVKLGNIVENCNSKRIPLKQADRAQRNGSYRYYGASGVIDYVDDYLFDGDYLLIGEDGNNLISRSTDIAFHANGKFWVNNHAHVLTSNGNADLGFLVHYINSINLEPFITGSAQPKLNKKNLDAIEIPLPPLDEQKRIAAILDKADVIRRKRQQAIKLADDFLRSVFLDMFGDLETKGWEITTVEKVAESTKGSMRTGPFGSQLLHSEFVEKGIAVLGIDNAVENKFKWGKQRFITEEKYQQLKRYTVKPDDVIITIMGTCGRCAVVPEGIPTSINTKHICCITLDKDKCLSSFLHSYFLYHPDCQKYLATNTKGAIMAGLNMGIVKGIPVPLVPLSLQVKYDFIVKQLNELSEGLSEHKENGNSLFNSLSQKVFAGEL
tara:strand:- start:30349 stop:31500 length:1152 start_codon:yes stop_codon:yes gene_type:complete